MVCLLLQKDPQSGRPGPKRPPHPSQDPLVMAAKAGDFEAVKQLVEVTKGDSNVLCAPCAAAAAAKEKYPEIVYFLAEGAAGNMMKVSSGL